MANFEPSDAIEDFKGDPRLTSEQWALFQALHRRAKRIAHMYIGGILVLEDGSNPDAVHQAAGSMRDLMDKAPEIADVRAEIYQPLQIVNHVRKFVDEMRRHLPYYGCRRSILPQSSFNVGRQTGPCSPVDALLGMHSCVARRWESRP